MKESFSELYARLYSENFKELEEKRKKTSKTMGLIMLVIIAVFLVIMLLSVFAPYLAPFLVTIFMVVMIICIIKAAKRDKKNPNEPREKTYKELFKEKIIEPLLENIFEQVEFNQYKGISSSEYNEARYKESYDRYSSEDLVIAQVKTSDNKETKLRISEVHTETESTDDEGHTTYTTVFHGMAGNFEIFKDLRTSIFIRSNYRVFKWNKDKVNLDMSEFEKLFDVESADKILAMRLLTSDVMAEMVDLYRKYKYRFEISIINNKVHLRISSGTMFEPNVFGSSMEYKQIERYYLVLKALISIVTHISETIDKLDI